MGAQGHTEQGVCTPHHHHHTMKVKTNHSHEHALFAAPQICRPSMRRAAAMAGHESRSDAEGNASCTGTAANRSTSINSNAQAPGSSFHWQGSSASESGRGYNAVGNATLGSDGSGVSAISFEQHSGMVRYPNSMSNLRRLRCYLLACQVRLSFCTPHPHPRRK
jgi:hypothetical protein